MFRENRIMFKKKKNCLEILVGAMLRPTFGLSSQELQGLNHQIRPTRNSWKPHIQGAGWRSLPRLNLVLQLGEQQSNVVIYFYNIFKLKKNHRTHTTEVLLRTSALKMLSSKLKKLTAISSTTTGPAWASSTVLPSWYMLHYLHTTSKSWHMCGAVDSLLLDIGQWSGGRVWERVHDVCWRCQRVGRRKSFTVFSFDFYCPDFLLPSFIF